VKDRALRDLAAYDDVTLPRRRRRRLDALLDRSPEARRELERQRAVRAALARIDVQAPPALRAEADRLRATVAPRARLRFGAAVGLAAALALTVAVPFVSGPRTSAEAMAALAHSDATEPAPAPTAPGAPVLARSFAGVQFPDWEAAHGWHAVGARAGKVAGRSTSTVFYEHEGHRLAYTVVGGAPLAPPHDARTVRAGGATLRVYRDGDHTVVAFERNGRTCVLAGHVIHEATAVKLAAWKPAA
jgi:hypothetical protein